MGNHKFKVGQKVIYEGLIGVIESLSTYMDGSPSYNLVSEENGELSCTANEELCELYVEQEIDQTQALLKADASSVAIQGTVGKITDKYFRDGNH